MNNKDIELKRITDIVVSCCSSNSVVVTFNDVASKSRMQNIVMTRVMLTNHVLKAGYSVSTIAQLLNRTEQAIRHLASMHNIFTKISRAYRIAYEECNKQINKEETN